MHHKMMGREIKYYFYNSFKMVLKKSLCQSNPELYVLVCQCWPNTDVLISLCMCWKNECAEPDEAKLSSVN